MAQASAGKAGTAYVDVRPDMSGFTPALSTGVQQSVTKAEAAAKGRVASMGANLGKTLWYGAGLMGAGALAGFVMQQFTAYEDSMNMFQAVTRASQEEMDRASTTAKALGNDLMLPGVSAAGAASAMTELAKAGLSVKDSINAARGALALAIAGQMDEAAAASTIANALLMFRMEGSKATVVADMLAASAASASGSVGDFSYALSMGGTAFASAKRPMSEFMASLVLMARQGIKGSDAGTALKTMMQRLQAPSAEAAKIMQRLGISVYDTAGNMIPLGSIIEQFTTKTKGMSLAQRDSAMNTLFGADAIRAANIVLMGGTAAWEDASAAVTREGAAAEMAAATSKGLGGSLKNVSSIAETLAINVGEKVAPAVQSFVDAFGTVLAVAAPVVTVVAGLLSPLLALAGAVASNRAVIITLAVVLLSRYVPATLAAAQTTAVMTAVRVLDWIQGIITGVSSATTSINGFRFAVGAATLGITLLVTEFISARGAADEMKQATEDAMEALKTAPNVADNYKAAQQAITAEMDKIAETQRNFTSNNPWERFQGQRDQWAVWLGGDDVEARVNSRLADLQRLKGNYDTSMESMRLATGLTDDAILKMAESAGVDLSGNTMLATTKMMDFYRVNVTGAPAVRSASAEAQILGDKMKTTAEKADALRNSYSKLIAEINGTLDANMAYEEALDSLRASLKENGVSLNIATDKGRANVKAIQAVVSATAGRIAQAKAENASNARLRAIYDQAVAAIGKMAPKSKTAQEAISRLARQMGLTPKVLNVAVTARTKQAVDDVQALKDKIAGVTGKAVTIRADVTGGGTLVASAPNGGGRVLLDVDWRAMGGPVEAGKAYIVGERRAELFVPKQDGTILPSVPSGFGSGGGETFHVTVNNPVPEPASESVPRALRRTLFLAGK